MALGTIGRARKALAHLLFAWQARMVAGQFVQQYYHVLKSYSKHLHRFYMEDSSFTISGKEGMAESKSAKGQVRARPPPSR
jgi:hypothetical protein